MRKMRAWSIITPSMQVGQGLEKRHGAGGDLEAVRRDDGACLRILKRDGELVEDRWLCDLL